jgi:hypothetical protein
LGDEVIGNLSPLFLFTFGPTANHVLDHGIPTIPGFPAADEIAETMASAAKALGGGTAGAFGQLLTVIGGKDRGGGQGHCDEESHAVSSSLSLRR